MFYVAIILAVVILIFVWIVSGYNSLVSLRQRVENSWSQIDVQLQRRYDLIPNLVETVKGYMTHESDTFAKIAELRTSWANASSVSEKAKIDNEISSTLKTIMAVSESYPELKADTSFLKLSDELRSTEDKISYSRQFYNDTVTRYNSKTELFPSNIIAGMFNFRKADLFMAESDEARKNVKVDFNK
jgi:LemA protein